MKNLEKNNQIQLIMGLYTLAAFALFVVFAAMRDGFAAAFAGFGNVVTMPAQMTLDYFKHGTVSGTFLNVGLVGLSCMLVFRLTGANLNSGSLLGYFLSIGFSFFGMNFVNIWPCILGTLLFAVLTKESLAGHANSAIFSTACAPFVSEMFFRYTPLGDNMVLRIALGIIIGLFIGMMTPVLAKHGPNTHKGHTMYNAAYAVGMIAILLYSLLFKATGVEGPTNTDLGDSIPVAVNGYALLTGIGGLILGFFMEDKTFKNVPQIFKKTGYASDLTAISPGLALINISLFNLFMTAYYNVIGSSMTGPTLAAIVCALACCAGGGHILNMIPIIIGYAIASTFCTFSLTTQAIILGLCYACAMTPMAGGYGPLVGIVAGLIHAVIVTQVVTFHNAFCFYNGGLTAFFVALMLGPVLDYFFEKDTEFHWSPIPKLKKK